MSRRWLKRTRLGIALIVLLAFTAGFADFRGIVPVQRLVQAFARMQFTPSLVALTTGAVMLGLGFVLVVALTLAFGRVYCSTLCPLGLMQDAVVRLAKALRLRRKPLHYARASIWGRYGVLVVVVLMIVGGAGSIATTHADPYSNFGRIVSGLVRPLLAALNNLLVAPADALGSGWLYRVNIPWPGAGLLGPALFVFVLVVALAIWRERIFCNTLCPVGTVLGVLARRAAFRLRLDRGACTKCASCLHACKAQCLDLRAGVIDASRCVACFNCLSVCPEQGLSFAFAWRRVGGSAESPSRLAVEASIDTSRRAFLAGALSLTPAVVRAAAPIPAAPAGEPRAAVTPPGARGTEAFLTRCTGCQLCVSACLTGVLRPAFLEYGFEGMMKPRMDFASAYCNYDCRRCGEACPTGAIMELALDQKKLTSIGVAQFTRNLCIVEAKGKDCAACSEHCPTKAVETVPFGDNLRLPQVNEELCIGCGACEFACPVRPQRAIVVAARATHTLARKPADEPPAARPAAGGFPF